VGIWSCHKHDFELKGGMLWMHFLHGPECTYHWQYWGQMDGWHDLASMLGVAVDLPILLIDVHNVLSPKWNWRWMSESNCLLQIPWASGAKFCQLHRWRQRLCHTRANRANYALPWFFNYLSNIKTRTKKHYQRSRQPLPLQHPGNLLKHIFI
jgi:hypothetical protein